MLFVEHSLPILTPDFASICPRKQIWWYSKSNHPCISTTFHVQYAPKNVYRVLSGDGHAFTHFDPLFYPNMPPKYGKCGWYFKCCHLCIFPTSHVTYSLKIPYLYCAFLGDGHAFTHFDPRFYPQNNVNFGNISKGAPRCHLHILSPRMWTIP